MMACGEHRAARWKRERIKKELAGVGVRCWAPEAGTRTFCGAGNLRAARGRADRWSGREREGSEEVVRRAKRTEENRKGNSSAESNPPTW